MKWNNYFYIVLLLHIWFIVACYDEKELDPSGITSSYSVPQGNHDYDNVIVEYYNKYGSCLLYKFTDKDTYWTPSGWMNGMLGDGGKDGYIVTSADENYIGEQLEVIRKLWFDSYSDEFLKEFLPVKIMLCSQIDSVYISWDFSSDPFKQVGIGEKVEAWYNYDNICVAYGNKMVINMTKADSLAFKNKVNSIFVESMIGRGKSVPTKDFEKSTNYNINSSDMYSAAKLWAVGIPSYNTRDYTISAEYDWKNFILMMLLCPEEFLTRVPEFNNDWDMTNANWDGILNPVKDVNGLLKKRYDIVRNYFKENYKMDLQQIGDGLKN